MECSKKGDDGKSKPVAKVVTAVARELVGFIWAIGTAAESRHLRKTRKPA